MATRNRHKYTDDEDRRKNKPERTKAQIVRYRETHKELLRERTRLRWANNPRTRELAKARRAKLNEAGFTQNGKPYAPKKPPSETKSAKRSAKYGKSHPEKLAEWQTKYRESHREIIAERARIRKIADPVERSKAIHRFTELHPRKPKADKAAYAVEYRKTHRAQIRLNQAKYTASHHKQIAKQRAEYQSDHQVRAKRKTQSAERRQSRHEEFLKREREWRQQFRDKKRETQRRYQEKHKEERREAAKRQNAQRKEQKAAWFQANKGRILEAKRANLAWVKDNRERALAYYYSHTEQVKAKTAKYAKANKEKVSVWSRNSLAKRLKASGSHSLAQLKDLYKRQGGKCSTCKKRISDKKGKNKYHVDHVHPLSKGGSNDISNIQLLCRDCNLKKSSKHPDEWAQQNGLLFC